MTCLTGTEAGWFESLALNALIELAKKMFESKHQTPENSGVHEG